MYCVGTCCVYGNSQVHSVIISLETKEDLGTKLEKLVAYLTMTLFRRLA